MGTGAPPWPEPDERVRRALGRSLELITDMVIVIEQDGTIVWANEWSEDLLGHELDDAVGQSFLDFIHPDEVADAVGALVRSLDPDRAGSIRTASYRALRADGSHVRLWSNGANVEEEGLIVVHGRRAIDADLLEAITEAVATGTPLDEVMELVPGFCSWRFEADSVPGVFYRTDDGRAVATGADGLDVFGTLDDPASPVAWLAKRPDGRHAGLLSEMPEQIRAALQPSGIRFVASATVPDPLHESPCLVLAALRDDQEAPITRAVLLRMAHAVRLILHNREQVVRLRRAASELQRFLADASHELRTPMTAIVGFADLLLSGNYTEREQEVRAVERIRSEGMRMAALVDDLFVLARLGEGRRLRHEPVDLARLARDAATDAAAAHPDRRIAVEAPEQVVVVGDPDALRQVVANLVGNACHHTPEGSPIELVVSPEGEGAHLDVVDHGPGVPEEQQAAIFERFHTGEHDDADQHDGAGLGLSIVQAIVAAHRGQVGVESPPDGGARFWVQLPRAST